MPDASVPPGADPATAALARKAAMAADVDARIDALEANIAARGKPGINASKFWTPGSLLNGGTTSTTIAVPGAAVGDFALAALSPAPPANLQVEASVTAADTVTVGLVNHATNVLLSLPASTLRVRVVPA